MRVVVVIATYGRPEILRCLLSHLEEQQRSPEMVIVSAPDLSHVPHYEAQTFALNVVTGASGLCAQRNHALGHVLAWSDVVTFLDDDFLPANNYLDRVVTAFQRHDDAAVIMGHAEVDGVQGVGLTFEEGLMALRVLEEGASPGGLAIDEIGAYGCNMSIRTASIADTRFDERLALYGWQEDVDFASRLRSRGRVIRMPDLFGVHLGFKAGRVSGIRFGYSQVANPAYLIRKGSMPADFGLRLMLRNICVNLVRSLWSEAHVDRRGRLKGNAIGLFHLAKGRIEPEYIRQL
ncbi:glycosyltransferase [Lichenihabitans sp. Uapishka_5]|uniref:glycosyltransferase family 2 protein n=1 Tax=Lichenihabitans sp. Uapishka_5 TaxID=3037302 RepID=UPI0029E7E67C|nr:glycosyltransferase [Lichenihabitans sp. Uapishka_5]MDX7950264.1 glycosyltransferase [Lichenihabitans sp. Uapishka_5]